MKFTWDDIVAVFLSHPWWFWPTALCLAWLVTKGMANALRAYAERPILTDSAFLQRRVRVDYRAGTITLPRGDTFPVSRVRSLRWDDFPRAGYYHAYVEVDDLRRPIHPVVFSDPRRPPEVVSRLRSAIEKAGGPRFSMSGVDAVEMVGRDFYDPLMASIATRVVASRRRAFVTAADKD